MTAGDFLAFVSSPHFLGDPLIHTQHLIGACTFERVEATEGEEEEVVRGLWQIRAAHQRVREDGTSECHGHGHAMIEHLYRREGKGGEWRLAGVKPNVRWNEGNFEGIFRVP